MLKQINRDAAPVIDDARLDVLLSHPRVQGYLAALDDIAPGLDLTIDRAIAVGLLAVREARADRLDAHIAAGSRVFDREEFTDLVAAALAFLLPLVEDGERLQASV